MLDLIEGLVRILDQTINIFRPILDYAHANTAVDMQIHAIERYRLPDNLLKPFCQPRGHAAYRLIIIAQT